MIADETPRDRNVNVAMIAADNRTRHTFDSTMEGRTAHQRIRNGLRVMIKRVFL